jgi:hypothetical protein
MTTQRQKEANRRNAQRSTGPRTEQGKAQASQNAIKHGLFCRQIVVEDPRVGEDPAKYKALVEALREEFMPRGALEKILVERIAVHAWRLKRAAKYEAARISRQIEADVLAQEASAPKTKLTPEQAEQRAQAASLLPAAELAMLLKYESQQERGLHRALKSLKDLQRDDFRTDAREALADRDAARFGRDQLLRHLTPDRVENVVPPWELKHRQHVAGRVQQTAAPAPVQAPPGNGNNGANGGGNLTPAPTRSANETSS